MKCTLVCSCGLLLEAEGEKLLIDGITEHLPPFFPLPEADFQMILDEKAPYNGIKTLAFTHLHPDHYSPEGVRQVCAKMPWMRVQIPEGGDFSTGVFFVTYHPISHTPVSERWMIDHYAMLVTAGGKTVYVSADSEPSAQVHREVLGGRKVDVAFWNSQHLSYPEMRQFMAECATHNYIYHLPTEADDKSGMRSKCRKNFERYATELQNVTVLEQYPSELEI